MTLLFIYALFEKNTAEFVPGIYWFFRGFVKRGDICDVIFLFPGRSSETKKAARPGSLC